MTIDAALGRYSVEFRELTVDAEVERRPVCTPLEFYKSYVAASKPVIFTGAIDKWPALTKWTNTYLSEQCGDKKFTVDITPNGRGDSICETVPGEPSSAKFVTPVEEPMAMRDFLDLLASSREDEALGVPYVQHQNNSMREEFEGLREDVAELGWASEALGGEPEAVNLWIGDERSITSFHKDHYENIYAVVAGEKIFTLLPPTDAWRMYSKPYPGAQWKRKEGGGFECVETDPPTEVPWIRVDPYPHPDKEWDAVNKFPRFFSPNLPAPLQVHVKAGEVLYLPALWFHHVGQCPDKEGRCIAVNYWYDMQFDLKWAAFNLVEGLGIEEEGKEGEGMKEVDAFGEQMAKSFHIVENGLRGMGAGGGGV